MDEELKEIKMVLCMIIDRIKPLGDFADFRQEDIKRLKEFRNKTLTELKNN